MPDDSIKPAHIAKGIKLENLLKQLLTEITTVLQNSGVKCTWSFNEKQGGRSRIGPDAYLGIFGSNKNYHFFIEAKNNNDIQWSKQKVDDKILRKFLRPECVISNSKSKTIWVLIGHTNMSPEAKEYLNSHNTDVLDIDELPLGASEFITNFYYEKMKGYFLVFLTAGCDEMENQHSNFEINIFNDLLIVKNKNRILQSYSISDIEGCGFIFLGPKLLDCFGVRRGERGGLKIYTPWSVYENSTKYLHPKKIGYGLNCVSLPKPRKSNRIIELLYN